MKNALTAVLVFFAVVILDAIPAIGEAGSAMTYELYSWQQPTGTWSFCVLPSTSSEKSVRQVFSNKTRLNGAQALKKKLAGLPTGSTVVWVARLPTDINVPKVKGSASLGYPSPELMAEIRDFAGAHDIELEMPTSSQ